ncbi:hypothetical protein PtA15_1A412 [Puccinia triticina]|uniref:Uncharacterized protein n=1 Tax=Puccinia triticina TaxID=208348 RepID=A0ABY7C7F2_9BASI|nr:uncharacterized protein PtA15_1A412 [Puccinia triticina]WAQ81074.1 hypothetical protein PtA15_1A412 [Puccinia triticina]
MLIRAMRTAINTASGYPPAGPRPLSRDTCTCTGAEFPCNSNHWNSPNFAVTTTPSPFLAFPSAPAQHILYTDEFDAILKRPLARHAKRRHQIEMVGDTPTPCIWLPTLPP